MKYYLLILSLISSTSYCAGQSANINQFDSLGRKDGKWIMYYDQYCKYVKDSQKATYYCYTHYVHGRRYNTKVQWGKKGYKLADSLYAPQNSGNLKLLDGKYTWYNKKGQLSEVRYYNKGELSLYQWFYPSGVLKGIMDYRQPCGEKAQKYSGRMTTYDKTGALKYSGCILIWKDKKGKYWGGMI